MVGLIDWSSENGVFEPVSKSGVYCARLHELEQRYSVVRSTSAIRRTQMTGLNSGYLSEDSMDQVGSEQIDRPRGYEDATVELTRPGRM